MGGSTHALPLLGELFHASLQKHYTTTSARSTAPDIRAVEAVNEKAGKVVAAYTFDAGPNAVVYYLEENEAAVAGVFRGMLPSAEANAFAALVM